MPPHPNYDDPVYRNYLEKIGPVAAAAETGDLDALRRLHESGAAWSEYTTSNASGNGHLDCLKYAHEHGCPWNDFTAVLAAAHGHLECLRYAHEPRGPGSSQEGAWWDAHTATNAARYGHLECLKYAHEHGCPWDEWTTRHAAQSGHLDCLEYAFENGCPWDSETTSAAAREGHFECLKYAMDRGCPFKMDKVHRELRWVIGQQRSRFEVEPPVGFLDDSSGGSEMSAEVRDCLIDYQRRHADLFADADENKFYRDLFARIGRRVPPLLAFDDEWNADSWGSEGLKDELCETYQPDVGIETSPALEDEEAGQALH